MGQQQEKMKQPLSKMAKPPPPIVSSRNPEKFLSRVFLRSCSHTASDPVSSGILREARWGSGATWEGGNEGKPQQQCDKRTPWLTFKAGPQDRVWNSVVTRIHGEQLPQRLSPVPHLSKKVLDY